MKKLKLLAIIPVMCLSSCSKSNIYGTYEFRLGKTDGTHLGVSAELINESATTKEHNHDGFEKMKLKAEFGSDFDFKKMIKTYVKKIPYIKDFPIAVNIVSSFAEEMIPKNGEIPGYFKKTENVNDKYGTRVQIGTDYFADLISEKIEEAMEGDVSEETKEMIKNIRTLINDYFGPESIEKLICAYIDDKAFTLQVPVSLDDIKNELTWNGKFLKVTPLSRFGVIPELYNLNDYGELPGLKGEARYGVHPAVVEDDKGNITKDEVKEMNEKYKFVFSNTYLLGEDAEGDTTLDGTFVIETVNNKKVLYFSPKTKTEVKEFSGKITVTDDAFGIKTKEAIHFKIDDKNKVLVSYKENTDKKVDFDEGFTDLDGHVFTFKTIMEDPFVFRDYHDVFVGLQKV